MEFDAFPPVGAVPGLYKQMKQGLNHNFNLGSHVLDQPVLVFNQVSPNNSGALKKVAGPAGARATASTAAHLISDNGGPT